MSKQKMKQSHSCQDCDLQVVITGLLLLLLPLVVHSDHLRLPNHPLPVSKLPPQVLSMLMLLYDDQEKKTIPLQWWSDSLLGAATSADGSKFPAVHTHIIGRE